VGGTSKSDILTPPVLRVNVVSESAFTVQGHGVHTAFTETIDQLRQYTSYKVIVNSNEPADVVHIHTIGPYSLHKLLVTRGVKIVSAHVTPDSFVGSIVGAKLWYGVAKRYLRWVYNRADAVLAVSQETLDELTAMGVTKPLYLVPNTINGELFSTSLKQKVEARQHLGIPTESFVVLSNGQVQPRKRIDTFINAASMLPDLTFIWVGGIPFKQLAASNSSMDAIMKHHPDNVTFTGVIPRENVISYYKAADLFFLPSNQETFGIVIVEAAAAGLPILLRDLDQYKLTFHQSYEQGTDEKFATQIKRFSSDKSYYDKWQQKAAAIAADYDNKTGAKRLQEVYEAVLLSVSSGEIGSTRSFKR
jgi:1,2-diacylglycerol-3-alpha-glucose alpha-1,2-galactosyltransferase